MKKDIDKLKEYRKVLVEEIESLWFLRDNNMLFGICDFSANHLSRKAQTRVEILLRKHGASPSTYICITPHCSQSLHRYKWQGPRIVILSKIIKDLEKETGIYPPWWKRVLNWIKDN